VERTQENWFNYLNTDKDVEDYKKLIEHMENQVEYYTTKKWETKKFLGYELYIQDEINMV
jgi:hypothetical protein